MINIFQIRRQNLPDVRIPRTLGDKIMEIVAVLLLLGIWVLAIVLYSKVPDVIPTHFNLSGEADHMGNKGTLFFMAGIATLAMVGTGYRAFFPSRKSRYPVQITDKNMIIQYALMSRYLRVINILVGLLFMDVLFSMSEAFLSIGDGLFKVLSIIIVALLLLSVLIYNILARRYR